MSVLTAVALMAASACGGAMLGAWLGIRWLQRRMLRWMPRR